jgi:carbon-monoxide dehydrogenase medium subunit
MYPAPFDYVSVSSLSEALELLERRGEQAKVLAGGQSLIPLMKLRLARPSLLVDINGIRELRYIRKLDGGLAIGALTRLADLEASALDQRYAILKDAVRMIADPQVRSLGTVGGNAAHGDPGNDLPAVFIALGASYVLESSGGRRAVPARDFYLGPFETALRPQELLVEIRVPEWQGSCGGSYVKLERRVGDYAIAGVAAQVALDEDGAVASAGIGYTNLAPRPIAGDAVARAIQGKRSPEQILAEARQAVANVELRPSSDLRGPDWYKADMARQLTARALKMALQRARGR